MGVGFTAAFTGGYKSTAKCFIAGTLVLTANGAIAIEMIKAGDMVYAANADTLEVALKPVLETYVRETSTLVHITVNGEKIISTFDHPYYVKGQGFVNAVDLCIGSELVDHDGNTIAVEQIFREYLHDETVDVYNFQVEDYHTYFVGTCGVWVHNANYDEAIDIVSKDSKRGRETKGKTELKIKDGDYSDTLKDFEAIGPSDSQTIYTKYGDGKIGSLSDGSTITARRGSSDGRPTLEIRKPNGRGVEFRYGKQGS